MSGETLKESKDQHSLGEAVRGYYVLTTSSLCPAQHHAPAAPVTVNSSQQHCMLPPVLFDCAAGFEGPVYQILPQWSISPTPMSWSAVLNLD